MFVLGIDPGLSRTGYGVLESRRGEIRAVAAGVIRTDPALPLELRLVELYDDLRALVEEYQPEEAAIEQVFVNNNLQTATSVGRASGVALLALAQSGLRVAEYTPTSVKMALAGYGGAPKEQVQKVIAMRLGLPAAPRPADAADALAVALCHVQDAGRRRVVEAAT